MLALAHSRRQEPFAFSSGLDSAFRDPYFGQGMNTYGSFDSATSFAPIPFSFYDSNSVSAELPPDTTNLAMFTSQFNRAFNPSSPRSELPPPTLSNTSAPSVPSNTPSSVGSPYSAHAQAVSNQESWNNVNQGLTLGPGIINNDGYEQGFGGVDVDSEIRFSIDSKVAEDFVGECTKISPSNRRSSNFAFSEQRKSSQPTPFPVSVRDSARGDSVTIDSVLEQANRAIHPSLFRSSDRNPSFTLPSSLPKENSQASPQKSKAISRSSSISASSDPKMPKLSSPSFSSATTALAGASRSVKSPITMSSFDTIAETSTPNYAGHFQSHFFAQSSGNFVPPLQSSCSCFLAVSSLHMLFVLASNLSFHLVASQPMPWLHVC
jgi:hypothetical protein